MSTNFFMVSKGDFDRSAGPAGMMTETPYNMSWYYDPTIHNGNMVCGVSPYNNVCYWDAKSRLVASASSKLQICSGKSPPPTCGQQSWKFVQIN